MGAGGGGVGGAGRWGHREGAMRRIQGAGQMDGHEGAALGNRRDEDRAKADGSPREAQMQVEAGMALLVCAVLPRA